MFDEKPKPENNFRDALRIFGLGGLAAAGALWGTVVAPKQFPREKPFEINLPDFLIPDLSNESITPPVVEDRKSLLSEIETPAPKKDEFSGS